MTIRQYLTRKKRYSMVTFLVGFVLFACSAITTFEQYRIVFAVLGMGIAVSTLLYATSFRCPNCRNSLTGIFSTAAWSVDKSAQVCPSCRIELDSPMPTNPV